MWLALSLGFVYLHSQLSQEKPNFNLCSTGIASMVQNRTWEGSSVDESAFCTFCEMIVFWIQVQLKQEKTKEKVFKYVNEVVPLQRNELFFPNFRINILCL